MPLGAAQPPQLGCSLCGETGIGASMRDRSQGPRLRHAARARLDADAAWQGLDGGVSFELSSLQRHSPPVSPSEGVEPDSSGRTSPVFDLQRGRVMVCRRADASIGTNRRRCFKINDFGARTNCAASFCPGETRPQSIIGSSRPRHRKEVAPPAPASVPPRDITPAIRFRAERLERIRGVIGR